jgi:hypothetical protein
MRFTLALFCIAVSGRAAVISGQLTAAAIDSSWSGPGNAPSIRFDIQGDGFSVRGRADEGYLAPILEYAGPMHLATIGSISMSSTLFYGTGTITAGGVTEAGHLRSYGSYIESPQLAFPEASLGQHVVDLPFTGHWRFSVYPCGIYEDCAPLSDRVYAMNFSGIARGTYEVIESPFEELPQDWVYVEYAPRIQYIMSGGTWTVKGDVAEVANPEPGSMVLAGLGLAIIYWVRKRKTSVSVPQLRTIQ